MEPAFWPVEFCDQLDHSDRSDVVSILDPSGKIIARGISRFASDEVEELVGVSNETVMNSHPWSKRPEIVHRDFLAPLISKVH